MSWLRWTTRIASGIASPLAWVGKPLPFQRSNVNASASRTPGSKSSRWTSMSATSHPDAKLKHGPLVRRLLQHADDLGALVLGPPGRGELEHVAHHLGGIGRVV